MIKAISDIMDNCYDMWNAIIHAINFCNSKKMNTHWCLSSAIVMEWNVFVIFSELEPCNDMFKVISDIMAHCYDMWNTIINELCIDVYYKQSLWNKTC